jgi:hypothetical protein
MLDHSQSSCKVLQKASREDRPHCEAGASVRARVQGFPAPDRRPARDRRAAGRRQSGAAPRYAARSDRRVRTLADHDGNRWTKDRGCPRRPSAFGRHRRCSIRRIRHHRRSRLYGPITFELIMPEICTVSARFYAVFTSGGSDRLATLVAPAAFGGQNL